MQAILIAQIPKETNTISSLSVWQQFLSAVKNRIGEIGQTRYPAEGVLVVDLNKELHLLVHIQHCAATHGISYRLLLVDKPDWIQWNAPAQPAS